MWNTHALVRLCGLYAEHVRRGESTISRLATGSGATIQRLRGGADITTRRLARAIQYLSNHWPDHLEWPSDVPRPESRPAEKQESS